MPVQVKEKHLELILASRSPRRAELLQRMGFVFRVISADVSENVPDGMDPKTHVLTLSRRKAETVRCTVQNDAIVVGADTIVFLDGKILEKPATVDQARAMLSDLSGRTHQVFTGLCLIGPGDKILSDLEETSVTFRPLDNWEIDDYVKTGSPMDKAGGYGIQDRSGLFVDRISGCFYNVVGFPLTRFYLGLLHLIGPEHLRRLMRHREGA